MNDYLFMIGRDPELSVLELKCYFTARNISFKIKKQAETAVLILLPELDFPKIMKDLGGTVKIGKVVDNLDNEVLYNGENNKMKYAISNYTGEDIDDLREYLKARMRDEKLKAAYKRSSRKEPFLMPNDVIRHNLMKEGFEILLYENIVAKTIAVFNPLAYEERDTKRPLQRQLHMISIRLAKILINISGAKQGDTLLDPFCGYGILLQEAMMMGINVAGVDNSLECVEASRKNLIWTKKRFNLNTEFNIYKGDSRNLSGLVKKADFAATEPYMGPLLLKIPMRNEAVKTVALLVPLYNAVLAELKKVVKNNIVMIVPRFRLYSGERIKLNFEKMLIDKGYKILREPLIYAASDSKIEREIWLFKA